MTLAAVGFSIDLSNTRVISDLYILDSDSLPIDQSEPLAWAMTALRRRELRAKDDDEGTWVFERIAARIADFGKAHLAVE